VLTYRIAKALSVPFITSNKSCIIEGWFEGDGGLGEDFLVVLAHLPGWIGCWIVDKSTKIFAILLVLFLGRTI
jgi:hypothetical protein